MPKILVANRDEFDEISKKVNSLDHKILSQLAYAEKDSLTNSIKCTIDDSMCFAREIYLPQASAITFFGNLNDGESKMIATCANFSFEMVIKKHCTKIPNITFL